MQYWAAEVLMCNAKIAKQPQRELLSAGCPGPETAEDSAWGPNGRAHISHRWVGGSGEDPRQLQEDLGGS